MSAANDLVCSNNEELARRIEEVDGDDLLWGNIERFLSVKSMAGARTALTDGASTDQRERDQEIQARIDGAAARVKARLAAEGTRLALGLLLGARVEEAVLAQRGTGERTTAAVRLWQAALAEDVHQGLVLADEEASATIKDLNSTLAELVEECLRAPWVLMTVNSNMGSLMRPLDVTLDLYTLARLFRVREQPDRVLVLAPVAVHEHFQAQRVPVVDFARTEYDSRLKETLVTLWSGDRRDSFSEDLEQLAAVAHGLI